MLEKTKEKPCRFTDFTDIEINGKNLSSRTVCKRLNELVPAHALEEMRNTNVSGRMQKVYALTERGERIVSLAEEFKELMEA